MQKQDHYKIVAEQKDKKSAALHLSPEQVLKGEKNPAERQQLVAIAAEKWPKRFAGIAKHIDKGMNSYSGMQVLNKKGKTYRCLKPFFQRDTVSFQKEKTIRLFNLLSRSIRRL